MAVSARRAEAIMGRAFRDAFDRQTFRALMAAAGMQQGELMVRCVSDSEGTRVFTVRLASNVQFGDLTVTYRMGDPEFRLANEEWFEVVGKTMAGQANREIENTYMALPDD
jgi:hypothetical protein